MEGKGKANDCEFAGNDKLGTFVKSINLFLRYYL